MKKKNQKSNAIRWIIPKCKQDQEIRGGREPETSGNFNIPLPENDGGVAVTEPTCKTIASTSGYDADEDIRSGRIKRFDDPEDMIASLKQPW